ncbi:MAG: hypothetical protein ACTTKH_08425 [Treponema sp.]
MKVIIYIFLFFIPFLFSCQKSNKVEETKKEEVKEVVMRDLEMKVLVILGQDYYKKTNILNCLNNEYSASSIKKNVSVIGYDAFEMKDFLRLKVIIEKIEEIRPNVIISLGLPEGAGKYLLQAVSNDKSMVVISAFPMEEILKLEAASDIVFDFELPDVLLNQEHDFYITDTEISLVLLSSFLASERIKKHGKTSSVLPIEDAKEAFKQAEKNMEMGFNVYTLKPYIDSDLGMASYNYILIYKSVIEKEDE